MSVRLKRDLNANIQSTARHEGGAWHYLIQAQGAGDVKPADVAAQVVDRIAAEVTATAEAAKPAKGTPAQGMQLLRLIRDQDKDIEKARTTLEQAQTRLTEIGQLRDEALREVDGTALLDRLAALDAQRVRGQAVIDQLAQDLRAKQQSRQQMLPSFRTDRDLTVGAALRKEKEAAQHAQAEAYAALEKAMGPYLLAIAQAQARLMALEAQATFGRIQIQLDHTLLGIIPPTMAVTTVDVRGQSALPPVHAQQRERGAGQQLVTTYSTE